MQEVTDLGWRYGVNLDACSLRVRLKFRIIQSLEKRLLKRIQPIWRNIGRPCERPGEQQLFEMHVEDGALFVGPGKDNSPR